MVVGKGGEFMSSGQCRISSMSITLPAFRRFPNSLLETSPQNAVVMSTKGIFSWPMAERAWSWILDPHMRKVHTSDRLSGQVKAAIIFFFLSHSLSILFLPCSPVPISAHKFGKVDMVSFFGPPIQSKRAGGREGHRYRLGLCDF